MKHKISKNTIITLIVLIVDLIGFGFSYSSGYFIILKQDAQSNYYIVFYLNTLFDQNVVYSMKTLEGVYQL